MIDGLLDAVVVAVGGALVSGAAFAARYFWVQSACLKALKEHVKDLDRRESESSGHHSDIYDRVNEVRDRLSNLEGKVDMLLQRP